MLLLLAWLKTIGSYLVRCDDTTIIFCLQESQWQREMVEQRYTKYKEIVWDLQHQLDESKRRIQEYRVWHTYTHTHRQLQFCSVEKCALQCLTRACSPKQQPTLFLFQSLIALLCSNNSHLDKDSWLWEPFMCLALPHRCQCVHCV